jgi:hypothetical protein
MECSDEAAADFNAALDKVISPWGTSRGIDVHLDVDNRRPAWLERARDCQIPDCAFPAEWVVEVAANGSIIEFAGCGAHRQEIAAGASSSAEVAWGDAEVIVRQI